VIAGEATRGLISGYVWRELDLVRVKGKHEPVAIFEPCGEEMSLANDYRDDITVFNTMIHCYRSRHWNQAETLLLQLTAAKPDRKLYGFYLDRIRRYQLESPPLDWDGVCTFTTK
jgi:adenylate cyclase